MSSVLPAVRDPLGVHPLYYQRHGARTGPTIASLLDGPQALRPDKLAIERYLRGEPDDASTCVEGIGLVPAGHRLEREGQQWSVTPEPALPPPEGSLADALIESIRTIIERHEHLGLALSGGLDSALILAIATRHLGRTLPVFTLAVDIPGYGEREATMAFARWVGATVHEIPATAEDFRQALPAAIEAVEVPLWNPHPVSKLLLARALRREGIHAVLTGDAADQVFGTSPRRNYLPLVGRLFRHAGIEPCSPFFDPRVLAHGAALTPDPHKRALREVATRWLPPALTEAPKAKRLAPDLGVERLVGTAALEGLARWLPQAAGWANPDPAGARIRCGLTTLHLLWQALGGHPSQLRACVASPG
ncbi:MAG: hypothetical protein K0V04_33390 [Deltaproteobacteria bacterium]|nr:hypothetical protein [Deltaproteobacteria bacterium]